MRLIDADDLLKWLDEWWGVGETWIETAVLADHIHAMPTIDAEPVVRCKDCKHWDFGDCYRQELTRPDDFCSYGERKEQ